MVTTAHQSASPKLLMFAPGGVFFRVEDGESSDVGEEDGGAEDVGEDPAAECSASEPLQHSDDGHQSEQAQRSEDRQGEDDQLVQVPHEPVGATLGEDQLGDVVDDEHPPRHPDDRVEDGGALVGEVPNHLDGVRGEEHSGDEQQWPFGQLPPTVLCHPTVVVPVDTHERVVLTFATSNGMANRSHSQPRVSQPRVNAYARPRAR